MAVEVLTKIEVLSVHVCVHTALRFIQRCFEKPHHVLILASR